MRRAPNIKAIKALNADVIIVGTDQKNLARPFSRIGRVMFYKSFSDKYRTNGKKSRTRFLQIAELFQLEEFAEKKLSERDAEIAQIKNDIHNHFLGSVPQVTVIRFSSAQKALVYGENSMISHTLAMLDIAPAIESSRSKWGENELTINKLEQVNSGIILYVEPVNDPSVFESAQWRGLSLVKANKVASMAAVWSYGGAMSVLYNARAIRDALLSMPLNSN